MGWWEHYNALELFSTFCGYLSWIDTLSQFNTSPINIEPLVTSVELGVGAHEYSLTCQILIGWKHHVICWLVWRESACDALLLIGRALGWWAWSARDHCMHFTRENAGELEMTESTLFWQLRANYTQKKCPTPQPVTLSLPKLLTVPVNYPSIPQWEQDSFTKAKIYSKSPKMGRCKAIKNMYNYI